MSRARHRRLGTVADHPERMRTRQPRSPPGWPGCRGTAFGLETRCPCTGADPWAPEKDLLRFGRFAEKVLGAHIRGGLVAGVASVRRKVGFGGVKGVTIPGT